jgi:DNA-nicking Smr family endonuclease
MDFGETFEKWEGMKKKARTARSELEVWLDEHGVGLEAALEGRGEGDSADPGDTGRDGSAPLRQEEARRLDAMRPQAAIDLHTMSAAEAERALGLFIEDAYRRGLEKVLVVHGKGIHSKDAPVLGSVTRRVIERSQRTGRFGRAEGRDGGSGALWVLIRRDR